MSYIRFEAKIFFAGCFYRSTRRFPRNAVLSMHEYFSYSFTIPQPRWPSVSLFIFQDLEEMEIQWILSSDLLAHI